MRTCRWGRDTMTREDVENLKECPDCYGRGILTTPSKNAHRSVTCDRCNGTGYVRKVDQTPSRRES